MSCGQAARRPASFALRSACAPRWSPNSSARGRFDDSTLCHLCSFVVSITSFPAHHARSRYFVLARGILSWLLHPLVRSTSSSRPRNLICSAGQDQGRSQSSGTTSIRLSPSALCCLTSARDRTILCPRNLTPRASSSSSRPTLAQLSRTLRISALPLSWCLWRPLVTFAASGRSTSCSRRMRTRSASGAR